MTATEAPVYISHIWERFAPHFCKPGKTQGRIRGLPDAGARLMLGEAPDQFEIWALPAHFLHAEGNFQFYDPVSRILFSGDLGASMGGTLQPTEFVTELSGHLRFMEGFHRRYMVSNKVLRWWADMVAELPIDLIVPQHGAPIAGAAVAQFREWVRGLECGIDRFGPSDYRLPD